ncbi:MAG: CPBP family intramembrane glutamic endopeptidase [Anaerococcus sp.]|nr:CPBP family intramembrane metalloprotease [Peptoniphilaceae bacterium]MDY3055394.1 CPBP family intramembrane glutamic endopeptidase [Anaerococcus sp.]
MKFVENQTIKKSRQEILNNDKKEANIYLYIILVVGAMFVGEIISGAIEVFIFGADNIFYGDIRSTDIYNIVSLFGKIFPTLLTFYVGKKYLNRSNFSLGLRKENSIKDYLQGLGLSFLQIGLVVVILVFINKADLSLNKNLNMTYLILFTLGWMLQGFSEELICRSLFMNGFTAFVPIRSAILFNALIFSFIHIGNDSVNIIALINLFLSGISYSLIFYLKDSIWMVAGAHAFWNMIQGNVFGISVSGFAIARSTIFRSSLQGSNLLTGGEFGIEASILCTLVEALVVYVLIKIIKKRKLVEK